MSIMSLSLLVTGATNEVRKRKAAEIAELDSSQFDTSILDTSESRGIKDVRQVCQKLSRRPFSSKYSTLIVLEAQNLTIEAQNAILITLEEPPTTSKVILTAATKESLLSTVSSRCQEIQLPSDNNTALDFDNVGKFLSPNFFDRWKIAHKLNLDTWLYYWRSVLIGKIQKEASAAEKENTKRILNYLKLILKTRRALKSNASPRLVNTILLVQTPTFPDKT
jgi:DNA polymerase III gamma/tau subunit